MVTEETFSVLTVLRCAVVTRTIMANNPKFEDAATAKSFADVDAMISASVKTKVSPVASDFKELRL